MTMAHSSAESRHRRHRWLIVCTVIVVVLTVYGAGIGWFAHRLEADLARTIQPLPTSDHPQLSE
jgi:hypothetical protein